ncbi:MAG TPA: hypothetical protein VJT67_09690 [Longimicrobiaceae bacterium]|nr:hypothetical protein [Longimicrobiaceae bacterium]
MGDHPVLEIAEGNWQVFRGEFEDYSEWQLRAALSYYELYPEEIDARLALEEYCTEEQVAAVLPVTRPIPTDAKQ